MSCFRKISLSNGGNANLPAGEEELLVSFFGEEYVRYRAKTNVGIPFIP